MTDAKTLALTSVVMGLGAFGCAHAQRPPAGEVAAWEYLIGLEDVLEVSVWRDADLSRTVPVRPDGKITLPLVGEVEVAGRTPSQVADGVGAALSPFVREPKVAVIVREVNSPRIFVLGEVARPGAHLLRGRVTLLQALALSGGFTPFADPESVVLLRGGGRGRVEVDCAALTRRDAPEDFPLGPGDTIYVP